ncbi:MAG: PEP-utilizing enzyme, partial [Acidimicrobiales bacterium]
LGPACREPAPGSAPRDAPGTGLPAPGQLPGDPTGGHLPAVDGGAALELWSRALGLSGALARLAWSEGTEAGAAGAAGTTLSELAGDRPAPALARLAALQEVDADAACEVLRLLASVGRTLWRLGALSRAEEIWALDLAEVPALLSTVSKAPRLARRRPLLRWQGFLRAAVAASGRQARGEAASSGEVTGLARPVRRGEDLSRVLPGEIVVLPRPLAHLAPVLWAAGGLVTTGGSVAAHLVEVARSLRVPAVVGAPQEELAMGDGPSPLMWVDGDRGMVTVAAGNGADRPARPPV